MITKKIKWVRQGNIKWELPWRIFNGKKRSKTPDLNDHISFVKFDLNKVSATIFQDNEIIYVEYDEKNHNVVEEILNYHGFEFDS